MTKSSNKTFNFIKKILKNKIMEFGDQKTENHIMFTVPGKIL